jgi:hypothetical protein
MIGMSIEEIESQIQSLKDTATSIFKIYAEKEGFPPSIVDELAQEAMNIFLDLYRRKKHVGKSFESLARSSILLAAHKRGIPLRNYKEVFKLSKDLGQNIPYSSSVNQCIEWLCYSLRLSEDTKGKAKEIASMFMTKTYKRPSQRVLAASSIYIAGLITGERKTQKEIADVARCTEVAIRNEYRNIIKTLKISLQSPNNIYTEEISLPTNNVTSNSKPNNSNASRSQDILTFIKSKIPEFEYLTLTQQVIEIHKLFPRLKPKAIAEILGTTKSGVRTILYKYRHSLIKA